MRNADAPSSVSETKETTLHRKSCLSLRCDETEGQTGEAVLASLCRLAQRLPGYQHWPQLRSRQIQKKRLMNENVTLDYYGANINLNCEKRLKNGNVTLFMSMFAPFVHFKGFRARKESRFDSSSRQDERYELRTTMRVQTPISG